MIECIPTLVLGYTRAFLIDDIWPWACVSCICILSITKNWCGIYIRAFEGLFSHRGRKEPYECFRQVELVKRSSNDFRQIVCSQSNCIIHKHAQKKKERKKCDEERVSKHFHSPNQLNEVLFWTVLKEFTCMLDTIWKMKQK